jgi:hypothetical protein
METSEENYFDEACNLQSVTPGGHQEDALWAPGESLGILP